MRGSAAIAALPWGWAVWGHSAAASASQEPSGHDSSPLDFRPALLHQRDRQGCAIAQDRIKATTDHQPAGLFGIAYRLRRPAGAGAPKGVADGEQLLVRSSEFNALSWACLRDVARTRKQIGKGPLAAPPKRRKSCPFALARLSNQTKEDNVRPGLTLALMK